jgi:hypothetical protein
MPITATGPTLAFIHNAILEIIQNGKKKFLRNTSTCEKG